MVSIPACHAGDRGSIPRRGDIFLPDHENKYLGKNTHWHISLQNLTFCKNKGMWRFYNLLKQS